MGKDTRILCWDDHNSLAIDRSSRRNLDCRLLSLKVFTLIELLVVIGIIAVLAALLFPALKEAKDKAREINCVSNLKHVYLLMAGYANDNNDWLSGNNTGNEPNILTLSWVSNGVVSRTRINAYVTDDNGVRRGFFSSVRLRRSRKT